MLRQQRQLFCVLRVYVPALTGFTINGIGREQAGRIAADQHHRTLKIFRGRTCSVTGMTNWRRRHRCHSAAPQTSRIQTLSTERLTVESGQKPTTSHRARTAANSVSSVRVS